MTAADGPTDALPTAERIRTTIDDDERASEAVIGAVAAVSGREPLDLAPLYGAIDPDAIDAVFAHAPQTDAAADVHLSFVYEGYRVSLRGDGLLTVESRSSPGESRDEDGE